MKIAHSFDPDPFPIINVKSLQWTCYPENRFSSIGTFFLVKEILFRIDLPFYRIWNVSPFCQILSLFPLNHNQTYHSNLYLTVCNLSHLLWSAVTWKKQTFWFYGFHQRCHDVAGGQGQKSRLLGEEGDFCIQQALQGIAIVTLILTFHVRPASYK